MLMVTLSNCYEFPPTFGKCSKSDENINDCLAEKISDALKKLKDGLPQLEMRSLDILEITSMTMGEGSGPVRLTQEFTNAKFSGFCGFLNLTVESNFNGKNDDKLYLKLNLFYPKLALTADFHAEGTMLSFPIKQDGPCTIEPLDVKVSAKFNFEKVKKKGKTYLKLKSTKATLLPTHLKFKISNVKLANGMDFDINPLLNDNDIAVYNDVREGYEKAVTMLIAERANQFFTKVSYDDMFLP